MAGHDRSSAEAHAIRHHGDGDDAPGESLEATAEEKTRYFEDPAMTGRRVRTSDAAVSPVTMNWLNNKTWTQSTSYREAHIDVARKMHQRNTVTRMRKQRRCEMLE